VIDVGLDDPPAALLSNALEVNALVFAGLAARADAKVQADSQYLSDHG
jgi:hypothetical protein